MDKKSIVLQGKPAILRNQNSFQHQGSRSDENHDHFKIERSDFPSLNEISVKPKNLNKNSAECSKSTLSYSDKLKAPPTERSSQNFKFTSNSYPLNKADLNLNKIKSNTNLDVATGRTVQTTNSDKQYSSVGRNWFSIKRGTSQTFETNSDASSLKHIQCRTEKPNYKSNVKPDFATEKRNENESRFKKEFKAAPPKEEIKTSSEDGWTVYQRHSSSKKNQMQDKLKFKDANSSEKCYKANSKLTEQSAGSMHDKYVGNKPTFNKYSGRATSKNYEDKAETNSSFENKNRWTTNSSFENKNRLMSKREMPYGNSNAQFNNSSDKFRSSKMNPEVYNSASSSYKVNQTFENPVLNENRTRTYSRRNDILSSSVNQTQIRADVSSLNNKHQPFEPKSAEPAPVKSKKKRKSKVKRQAAFQTGKLFILTPEAHSKILNQSSCSNTKSQSNVVTNINDDEEYPELGLRSLPKSSKEIPSNSAGINLNVELPILSDKYGLKVKSCNAATSQSSILNDCIADSEPKAGEIGDTVGEISDDAKLPVHSNDPITISLFQMLFSGKSKKKEFEEKIDEEDSTPENSPVKIKTKKVINQSVNPLASSKPTVKRGKEREQPKLKKQSKIRKLILMGRQMKKENMLHNIADIQSDDKSDIDNDIVSDGSSLSPVKSPGFDDTICGPARYDSPKDNLNPITDVLEDQNPCVRSCKKLIFPDEDLQENELLFKNSCPSTSPAKSKICIEKSASSINSTSILFHESASQDEVSEFDKKEYETPDEKFQDSCESFVEILEKQNTENSEILSQELQKLDECFKNVSEENALFEGTLKYQSVESQNLLIDAFCSALAQSILVDCMLEVRLSSYKDFDDQKNKILDVKLTKPSTIHKKFSCAEKLKLFNSKDEDMLTECTLKNLTLFEDNNLRNVKDIINAYCDSLVQSILNDCLSEIKFLDCKLTAADNISSSQNLGVEGDLKKVALSFETENIEMPSKSGISAFSVEENTNILEDSPKNNTDISSAVNKDSEGNMSEELETFLKNSLRHVKPEPPQSKFTDKEKLDAAKILLHTRRFRDYCNHFATKDIDEAVFNLIDDLARFQDRMHQKDPVKARVKRRLMYGIKEIKKHMTLKKLKGIIIATDIEDNKTQGGLNDLLKEVISLSDAYHIPYVFSHKRYNLGKVCRKSAPVSCVGILNYEGSEKNFKKMLELQEESKCDYILLTKKIVQELTDHHIGSLFEIIKEPIVPYEKNKTILRELFGIKPVEKGSKNSDSIITPENVKTNIEPKSFATDNDSKLLVANEDCKLIEDLENPQESDKFVNNVCIDTESLNTHEYFGTLDVLEREQIHTILKKYNVIKT